MRRIFALILIIAVSTGVLSGVGSGPNESQAGPLGDIQDFALDWSVCFNATPAPTSLECPAPNRNIPSGAAGQPVTLYQTTDIQAGSRLTDVQTMFLPAAWGFSAGTGTVGDYTARYDLFCDTIQDVQAGGPESGDLAGTSGLEGPAAAWPEPGIWIPYPLVHIGTAPTGSTAYVNQLKPTPPAFSAASYERAQPSNIWLGSGVPMHLAALRNGVAPPIDVVTEAHPYAAGLRATTMIHGIDATPPTATFLCKDGSHTTVMRTTQWTAPSTAGLYPVWSIFTSQPGITNGGIKRIVDLHCVSVGSPGADSDGDCLLDSDAAEGSGSCAGSADGDNDKLVDGIEKILGTAPCNADTDGDGASDYDELFQFTNPFAQDTDADGSLDKQDNGSDEVGVGVVDDTLADDNCPAHSNSSQTNSDSVNDPNSAPTGDATNPSQDSFGDACDTDDDNDGLLDVAEGLHIALAPSFCAPDESAAPDADDLDPLDPDTDNDLILDGAECQFGSNPGNPSSRPTVSSDALSDGPAETFYRTQGIFDASFHGQNHNPDGDSSLTGDADLDSDSTDSLSEKLADGFEVLHYGTNPANNDSDRDGCRDGQEAGDVTGNRSADTADLQQIAQKTGWTPFSSGNYRDASGATVGNPTYGMTAEMFANYDVVRTGTLNVADLQIAAAVAGTCPAQAGPTIVNTRQ